jgi:hypothetical protein
MPWSKPRPTLMEVHAQKRALQDLGVVFELGRVKDNGDPEVRIAGCSNGMLQEAQQFRDAYETELRCVILAKDDTRWLMSLDFLRWRVDQDHFGPLPGMREIIYRSLPFDDKDEE